VKDRNIYINALLVCKRDIALSIKMRQSKLFGEKELILLEKRIEGNKKDPTGLWSRKVKPKVIEMVNEWMPRRKQLKKVVREIRASCENNTICK